jgi:hypothetical protein
MKSVRTLLIGMLFLGITFMLYSAPAVAGDNILEWDTMAAAPGTALTIRDVNAGGAPWVVDVAKGRLRDDGFLRIKVRGLVLASDSTNPSDTFSGVVSCLDSAGATVNTSTAAFPAPDGDAVIKEKLLLPNPCFAPIIFVVGESGNWFAVTGGGPEADDDLDDDADMQHDKMNKDKMKDLKKKKAL